ncbi:uncharacterized protein N7511_008504 [Penicillium nucicola]|uniref:uncharacterized protein n=1 Tax=Penicillium nucicola TaxID=1850975 RepID=UPI002544E72F|nr:uncharacterized protein N7511_008504 [Penicillium nucicola]KAJ5751539.1 hypothetical protein N7511_008504 [Penicillium nucicola]
MQQDHLLELEQLSSPLAWNSQGIHSPILANKKAGQHTVDDWVSEDRYVDSCTVLDTYDWKPLPPRPLDPNRGSHRTSADYPSERVNHHKPNVVFSLKSQPNLQIHSCFGRLAESSVSEDHDQKNKPLPLEPFYPPADDRQAPLGPANADRYHRPRLSSAQPQIAAQSFPRPSPKPFRQPSLPSPEQLSEQRLLCMFFGFDLMGLSHLLNNDRLRRVRHYLASQPLPDMMVDGERYPTATCAWLRNFIVDSPYRLNLDRGRLRGLRLDDNASHNINRGFGLLWDFVEACGSKARCAINEGGNLDAVNKEDQLRWFQVSVP